MQQSPPPMKFVYGDKFAAFNQLFRSTLLNVRSKKYAYTVVPWNTSALRYE